MPIKLKVSEVTSVTDAIVGAFVNADQLRDALAPILKAIDGDEASLALLAGRYRDSVWTLVHTWNGRGLIADLIGGLRRAAPKSPELKAFECKRLATAPAGAEIVELQGFVTAGLGHLPAAAWFDAFGRRMRAVCRIELVGLDPPGLGTGFLVGPDLVLTAYHVVELVLRQPLLADTALCRFECFDDTKKGTPVALRRPQWIEDQSLPGGIELVAGGAEPDPDQLDFALLRLKRKIDAEPFRVAGIPAAADHPLIVLQHPRQAPLRISFGHISGFNAGGTRLRHTAATQQGSSGSPCLNQNLDLVGLHNAARYSTMGSRAEYNTGAPIVRVAPALAAKGFALDAVVAPPV